MVNNCGRGIEIAISKFKHLSMTDIKKDNGIEFQTFKQYVMRLKTLGEIFNYSLVTFKIFHDLENNFGLVTLKLTIFPYAFL